MRASSIAARIKAAFSSNRAIVYGIKYIPVVSTILLSLHVGFLLMGWHEVFTVGLSAVLLVALLILLSIKFRFCALHKAMIVYMAVMTLCICIQRCDGFGITLRAFRLVMFAIGVALTAMAIIKIKDDGCGQK